MSSDEVDTKMEENNKDPATSGDEAEEKINSKPEKTKKKADPPKIKQPAKKRVKTEQAERESKKEEKKKEKQEGKKEKEEKDEENEDSDEENGIEDDKVVPLLDQPLEVTGSRKRKEIQRFQPVEQKEEKREVEIPQGKGKALGDIPRVDLGIQRAKIDDLKLLHRLCFGRIGKATILKKNVKKFNGFEFEEASDEYEKKKVIIEKNFKKVTVAHLKNICIILDIEKSGTKDDILARILSFLTCPVDSGRTLPGEGRTKREGVSPKNYDEGEEKFDSKKKASGKSKKKEDSDESGKELDNEKDQSEEETEEVKPKEKKKEDFKTTEDSAPEKEEEKDKDKEEEEKPKKGSKKGKRAAEPKDKKVPNKKKGGGKKAAEKKPESDEDKEEDSDSESEEPLVKKPKAPPTDDEIKTYVKSLLEGADLEQITMKKVCQEVYAHYPDFDLGHKKEFIKTTVKSLISS